MEKKRNIQVGNFFWFGEEIVQVYDKCAWELLTDNEHKNRYSVMNKEGEIFGCGEEDLKDILLSEEMLKSTVGPYMSQLFFCGALAYNKRNKGSDYNVEII